MFKKVNTKQNFPEQEEKTIKFWKENKTFEKSVDQRPESNRYVFYDGPPFITGTPHYGSLLPSIAKDVVPRYQTMNGKKVERVWGWDAHGLPIENKVEKELGLKNRRDIEEFGIQKFIDECYKYTKETSAEWEWYIDHIGRWVDFENSYKTTDQNYMESVIWVFKQLYEKGLVYEGIRTSLYCTRCGTPVSNFEIAMDNSYKDMKDPAVTVKFKVIDNPEFEESYILAWTTTPWTLPANRALVVDEKEDYVLIEYKSEKLILAKKRLEHVLNPDFLHGDGKKDSEKLTGYKTLKEFKGKELVGSEYQAPYDFFPPGKNDFKVYSYKGMVHMEEGTGIVHSAPGFGDIDTEMGKELGLTLMNNVDEAGLFTEDVKPWAGVYVKKADKGIIEDLGKRNLLFKHEQITHRYPYCWRCETPLIHRAQDSWYINIEKIRNKLKKNNEPINWVPKHLKTGRFGKGLDQAPDWGISRTRYWATPMPIWKHPEEEDCKHIMVFGSIKEIEEASGQKVIDLHRPKIDAIKVKCEKCGEEMTRIPEVLDVWLDSASMPYGQRHYPFENKKEFDKNFPADFIVEYIAQTRAWFYVMHVVSTGLFDKNSFKNVVSTGVIFGTDGRKMSKSYGNYPDPKATIQKYGGDALRMYMMGSKIMVGEDINISEDEIREQLKVFILPLWNSYSFLVTYANIHKWTPNNSLISNLFDDDGTLNETYDFKVPIKAENHLDKWIITRLQQLIREVRTSMDEYQIPTATRGLPKFLEDLSKWYIRRSRGRFADGEIKAFETLYYVLVEYIKLLAPFAPFITEAIYENLVKTQLNGVEESIHLASYPKEDTKFLEVNASLLLEMETVRELVTLGQAARVESGIKVRQPLGMIEVISDKKEDNKKEIEPWMAELLKEELNVKEVKDVSKFSGTKGWAVQKNTGGNLQVALDTNITKELEREGLLRELSRMIQSARKKKGFMLGDTVSVKISTESKRIKEVLQIMEKELKEAVSANKIEVVEESQPEVSEINKEKVTFSIV